MEEIKNNPEEQMHHWEKQHRRGRLFAGLFIIGAGSLFLAREMGIYIPSWVFTWQIFLIVFGMFAVLKSGFRSIGGLIMMAIGASFLMRDYLPEYNFSHLLWPVVIILFGLFIMFRPRRGCPPGRRMYRHRFRHYMHEQKWQQEKSQWQQPTPSSASSDDYLEITSVFSGVKKNIITKNFKGGEITCVCGGGEVNFTQSDIEEKAELEVTAVLGGVRLIVPAHWEIKSEITAFLGGVEDKRPVHKEVMASPKTLVLKGTAVLGGIEINSF